nr:ribonuclease H-like domain-containing protein [Tanacetum cinerariifolium]
TEAVATACYVLNRVLVAKPHNKTPYELLTGDKPAIGYLKPFGCQVTILNTRDYLGKFDEKADEWYIVGYSIPGKAYRVYNLVTGKIVETMNIKFLENLPSVEGIGQPWLFDIDYLTDSLNYARIRNTNLSARNQGPSYNNAGCQDLDSDSDDEQDVIIVQNSPTPVTSPVHDVPNHEDAAQSVLSPSLDLNDDDMEELSSLQTQEQEGKDAAQRLGLAFPTHVVTHEASSIPAKKSSSVSPASTPTASAGNTPPVYPRPSAGRSSKSIGKKLASSYKSPIPADRSVFAGKSIPADRSVSTDKSISADRSVSAGKSIPADRSVSADKSISADRSVSAGKFIPADRFVSTDKSISTDRSISATRDTNYADRHPSKLSSNAVFERFLPALNTQNSDIHDGLKLFDCPSTGIFSSLSYDDEYHGPDISNQAKEILVNPVTTKKVNEAHPHSLIIGDLHTPVQTRKKAKAQVPTQNAFVSYIQDQRRNNHTDFHLYLFSCFLSQMEPTSVA